jgi:hypothetical protein
MSEHKPFETFVVSIDALIENDSLAERLSKQCASPETVFGSKDGGEFNGAAFCAGHLAQAVWGEASGTAGCSGPQPSVF